MLSRIKDVICGAIAKSAQIKPNEVGNPIPYAKDQSWQAKIAFGYAIMDDQGRLCFRRHSEVNNY